MAESSLPQRLRQRAEQAVAATSRAEIESFLPENNRDVLLALARNPHLQETDLLRLLERKDLTREVVLQLAQHPAVVRSPSVQFALVRHPKTPRAVSLPLMKFLHVHQLLRAAQAPGVPVDVKMVAEEMLIRKLAGLPRGEQISMARRGTGRIAAHLLVTSNLELIGAALNNPYVTEANLLKVLRQRDLPPCVVEQLAQHQRWSSHYDLRLGLIRHPLTPLARVLAFLPDVAVADLQGICLDKRMLPQVRNYIEAHCAARLKQ